MDSSSPALPTVSPYLVVEDASALIDFATACFGADEVDRRTRPNGSVAAVSLRIGDSVIILTERDEAASPTRLHVYVENVAASYERALAHGATSLAAPEAVDSGGHLAGVNGPAGVQWWMSTAPSDTEAV